MADGADGAEADGWDRPARPRDTIPASINSLLLSLTTHPIRIGRPYQRLGQPRIVYVLVPQPASSVALSTLVAKITLSYSVRSCIDGHCPWRPSCRDY